MRAYDLMEDLRKARAEHRLDRRMHVCLAPKALAVDEFGIWLYDPESATAFFSLVSARCERGRTIERPVKSNFAEGLGVFKYFISTQILADASLRSGTLPPLEDASPRRNYASPPKIPNRTFERAEGLSERPQRGF